MHEPFGMPTKEALEIIGNQFYGQELIASFSTGGATIETIKKYIEQQGKEKTGRKNSPTKF